MRQKGSEPRTAPVPHGQPRTVIELARAWARILVAAGVVAAIVAVSGGFGTRVLAVVPRIAYWIGLIAVGAAIGIVASRWIVPRAWLERRSWLAGGFIALLITAPMTLVVAAATTLVNHRPLRLMTIIEVFPSTLATTAGVTALAFLMRRRGPMETHARDLGAPPPRFLERLPAKLEGAEVWAVEAEDHYLRLHTSKGQDLILMRLSDAIAELEGIEGAQTHRSWWVARSAVSEAARGDGRATLTLKDGAEAPVSRGYAKRLREAGWF